MRDIREELYQWLTEVQDQKADLERLEGAIQTALEAQKARFDTPLFEAKALAQGARSVDAETLNIFIQTHMDDDHAWSVDQLVEAAQREGISFGDKSPSRVINIALVNLYNKKRVQKVGEGLWRRPSSSHELGHKVASELLGSRSPS